MTLIFYIFSVKFRYNFTDRKSTILVEYKDKEYHFFYFTFFLLNLFSSYFVLKGFFCFLYFTVSILQNHCNFIFPCFIMLLALISTFSPQNAGIFIYLFNLIFVYLSVLGLSCVMKDLSLWRTGLAAPWHVASSQTSDRTLHCKADS